MTRTATKRLKKKKPDNDPLAAILHRADILCARVREVISGKVCALFIYGPGGHGKSHHALNELQRQKVDFIHHNSHCTPRALFDSLYLYPEYIHIFEDLESLYKMPVAANILRTVCEPEKKHKRRVVTYETAKGSERFVFSGGVIIVSNEDLSNKGILGAVASRCRPLEWRLTPEDVKTLINAVAKKGLHGLTPKACKEVADFVVNFSETNGYPVEMRTYCDHALPSYKHWRDEKDAVHWKEIVASKLRGQVILEKRADRIRRERQIAAEVHASGGVVKEKIAKWKDRTEGKSQAAYYFRLKEAKAEGLVES